MALRATDFLRLLRSCAGKENEFPLENPSSVMSLRDFFQGKTTGRREGKVFGAALRIGLPFPAAARASCLMNSQKRPIPSYLALTHEN